MSVCATRKMTHHIEDYDAADENGCGGNLLPAQKEYKTRGNLAGFKKIQKRGAKLRSSDLLVLGFKGRDAIEDPRTGDVLAEAVTIVAKRRIYGVGDLRFCAMRLEKNPGGEEAGRPWRVNYLEQADCFLHGDLGWGGEFEDAERLHDPHRCFQVDAAKRPWQSHRRMDDKWYSPSVGGLAGPLGDALIKADSSLAVADEADSIVYSSFTGRLTIQVDDLWANLFINERLWYRCEKLGFQCLRDARNPSEPLVERHVKAGEAVIKRVDRGFLQKALFVRPGDVEDFNKPLWDHIGGDVLNATKRPRSLMMLNAMAEQLLNNVWLVPGEAGWIPYGELNDVAPFRLAVMSASDLDNVHARGLFSPSPEMKKRLANVAKGTYLPREEDLRLIALKVQNNFADAEFPNANIKPLVDSLLEVSAETLTDWRGSNFLSNEEYDRVVKTKKLREMLKYPFFYEGGYGVIKRTLGMSDVVEVEGLMLALSAYSSGECGFDGEGKAIDHQLVVNLPNECFKGWRWDMTPALTKLKPDSDDGLVVFAPNKYVAGVPRNPNGVQLNINRPKCTLGGRQAAGGRYRQQSQQEIETTTQK